METLDGLLDRLRRLLGAAPPGRNVVDLPSAAEVKDKDKAELVSFKTEFIKRSLVILDQGEAVMAGASKPTTLPAITEGDLDQIRSLFQYEGVNLEAFTELYETVTALRRLLLAQ
ncbi:hypothetical protein [Pseudoxanthomonas mexicana]